MHFSDDQIARVTHQANKAYCEALGDYTQPQWESAPEWQRKSAIAGIAAVRANPLMNAADQHASWMDHKLADGWVYGPKKDADKKTHDCLVPYHQLPEKQQAKDKIFGSIARAMLGIKG